MADDILNDVASGMDELEERLKRLAGKDVPDEERVLLTTLTLSLDMLVKRLEQNGHHPNGSTAAPDTTDVPVAPPVTPVDPSPTPLVEPAPSDGPPILEGIGKTERLLEPVAPSPVQRRRVGLVGRALTVVGALVGLFLLFEFAFSDLSEARNQRMLLSEMKTSLAGPTGSDTATASSGSVTSTTPGSVSSTVPAAPGSESALPDPGLPDIGDAVAILEIPALDLEKAVIEGTGPVELEQGPGHYRHTPLPGQPGNSVIAGRRTTYGAPFSQLDELAEGDTVVVSTVQGAFEYTVTSGQIVEPGEEDVLSETDDNRLTLVTSNPEYLPKERMVVVAELNGTPVAPLTDERLSVVNDQELGFSGDPAAVAGIMLWSELLLLVLFGAFVLYRRWSQWATYLLTTPVVIALTLLLFESFGRLMPATL